MKRNELDMTEGKTLKTWEWAVVVEVSTRLVAVANSLPSLLMEASLEALEEAFLAVEAVGLSFIFDC